MHEKTCFCGWMETLHTEALSPVTETEEWPLIPHGVKARLD